MANERVFKNLIVLAHRPRRIPGVGSDCGKVDLFAAGEARYLEKPGKALDRSR
jgi:hypothetical protein